MGPPVFNFGSSTSRHVWCFFFFPRVRPSSSSITMNPPDYPQSIPRERDVDDDPASYEKVDPALDDPFGNEEVGEVKYRVMKWW